MTLIRMATPQDAAEIVEIYRPYVEETVISFETEVPSLDEMRSRLVSILERYPWLVWDDGGILGYAYAGPYRARNAYFCSVESAVYVRRGHLRKGIGKALYRHLLDLLKEKGFANVVGGVALPNPASVALHESLGFEKVAQFQKIGFKQGEFWDVGFWQLRLPTIDGGTGASP